MRMNRIIAAVTALLVLLVGTAALAQGSITVQGVGSVKVDSNRAGISLGVREVDTDITVAQSRVNEKIAAIVEAMKSMGVADEDIITNGIGIYPNYNYDENGETISGYTANNNIYVTVSDVDNIGAYIDAAFAVGANSLDYVDFSATGTDDAAAQALALAVDSAKEKAKIIADAAGVKLGGILEIRDGSDSIYEGTVYAKDVVESDTGAGTNVMAAKQTVSAAVSITFALEDGE